MSDIIVRAPDGSTVRFPAGTPDATIERVMRENYPPASRQLSQRRTATVAMETEAGRPLTLEQRAAFNRVPGGYATSGEVGTAQRPIPLAEGDDGSRLTIGQFGITADGRYVEGTRPRQVQLGGRTIDAQTRRGQFVGDLQNDTFAQNYREGTNPFGAATEGAVNALTLNQAPRLFAAMQAPVLGAREAFQTGSLQPFADAYQVREQQMMDRRDMLRNDMPVSSFVGEVVGGTVSGAGVGNAAARMAPNAAARLSQFAARGTPQAAAAGAAVGAPMGALYGLGERDPIQGATQGAIGGAIGGAAAPYVVRGAAGLGRAAARAAGRPVEQPGQRAARVITRRLAPDAEARLAEAEALGLDPLTPLDVMNNSGRRVVRAVGSREGAQDIAIAYGDEVREALPDRAGRIARQISGQPADIERLRSTAQENIMAVDQANYGPLQNQRVEVSRPILESLNTTQGRAALRRAAQVANTQRRQSDVAGINRILEQLDQGGNVPSPARDSEGGSSNLPATVSLGTLENVYRIMRDRGSGMVQATGPQAAMRVEGRALAGEANAFGGLLAQQYPDIAAARAASSEARQANAAIESGLSAFRPGVFPEELATAYSGLAPSAQPFMQRAAQADLQRRIGENPSNAISMMTGRPAFADRLAAMGVEADPIRRSAQIEQARLRAAQAINPNAGSQTQLRQADAAELDGFGGGRDLPVTPAGMFGRVLNDFGQMAIRRGTGLTAGEMDELMRIATSPADLQALRQLAAEQPALFSPEALALIGAQTGVATAN